MTLSATRTRRLPSEADDGLKEDVEGDEQREKRLNRTISIFEAAMLAFVAVLAAWSGYAAAKWSTESSLLLATAGADRAKANAASLDAVNALNFDATTFNDWFTAYVGGNRSAMAIAENRFTPNLDAAFRAWLATGPETNPAAPPGPTYMPQYHQPQKAKAAKLNAQATVDYAAGEKAGSNSDDYVRTTVYLATVLFLAGIGSHFAYRRSATASLVLAGRSSWWPSCSWLPPRSPPELGGDDTARGCRNQPCSSIEAADGCPARDGALTGHLATGEGRYHAPRRRKRADDEAAGQGGLAWWWRYVLLSQVPPSSTGFLSGPPALR